MKKYISLIVILLFFFVNAISAQEKSKLNLYITYKHSFGFSEKNDLWNIKKGLYGNALLIKGTYRINSLLACGAGIGMDVLRMPKYTTFPLFASIHVTPFENKNLFFYNDTGYSLYTPGLHEELGAGYKLMLSKPVALTFHLGYSLKQMKNGLVEYDNGKKDDIYTARHSLFAGIGFVF